MNEKTAAALEVLESFPPMPCDPNKKLKRVGGLNSVAAVLAGALLSLWKGEIASASVTFADDGTFTVTLKKAKPQ